MNLNSSEIRRLRQRLGWSLAEMARRMGCSCDLINAWEAGTLKPEPEACGQLQSLNHHVESHAARLHQEPTAEVHMAAHGLGQLTGRALLGGN